MSKNYSYIIADHIRAACVTIPDGVTPSGKQRGYVLRRLIRRALSASVGLGIDISNRNYFEDLVDSVIGIYDGVYENIKENREHIVETLFMESQKYLKAMKVGEKEWGKVFEKMSGGFGNGVGYGQSQEGFFATKTWDLYQTHGVPIEVSEDLLEEKGLVMDEDVLNQLVEEHQKKAKDASKGQFKSGVGEDNEKTRGLHTTTHILHRVLMNMFGEDVRQVGSAITSEKARFDFTFDRKLEDDELEKIASKVQEIIDMKVDMCREEMNEKEAREVGATGLFGEKYGNVVTVYSLIDADGNAISREFCAGPHVKNTSEIGKFMIIKQKSVGQGKRRLEYDIID